MAATRSSEATDPSFTFARVFGLMAETMTFQQRRRASAKLRALDGNATETGYFAGLADALDEYTDEGGSFVP